MAIAHSKITAQGRTSVPAEVRRRLGVGPGSIIEWIADEEQIVVRRPGRYTSDDIRRALFPKKAPEPRTLDEMTRGIRRRLREKPG